MTEPKKLKVLPKPAAASGAPATHGIALALRALKAGNANEYQQKNALEWIVAEACAKRHYPYHESDRDTCFALGRLFVAEQIVGLLNCDLATLKEG